MGRELPARSFFGDLASRLQLWLGLETEVPVEYTTSVVPVIIAGDATLAGYGTRLRSFGRSESLGFITTSSFGLKLAGSELVAIDEIIVAADTAATVVEIGIDATSAADQFTINSANALLFDKAISGSDFAPVLTGTSTGAVTIPAAGLMWRLRMGANETRVITIPRGFVLLPVSRFYVVMRAGGGLNAISVRGHLV